MKQVIVKLLSVAFFCTVQSITAIGENVGSPQGSFSLTPTGGASYNIGIDLPKGVNGMEPTISVSYNSQSGNGVAGYGFNISGSSAITRGPKSVLHDGAASGVTYSTADALFLDGKRLLIQSGTEGMDGAVYQPEGSPFTTVTLHNSTTQESSWFEVETPDGMRWTYGGTSSHYINYQNSQRVVAAWYAETCLDPQGNKIYYSYFHDDGYYYLSEIGYGSNSVYNGGILNTVSFEYEARPDTVQFYSGTMKIWMSKRLKKITVSSAITNTVYREYDFIYSTTLLTNAGYSILSQVTEKSGSGAALRPIRLDWTAMPDANETAHNSKATLIGGSNSVVVKDRRLLTTDLNGDGVSDILQISKVEVKSFIGYNVTNYCYVHMSSINGDGNISYSVRGPFDLGFEMSIDDWKSYKCAITSVDYNGDGYNDILMPHYYKDGNSARLYVYGIYGKNGSLSLSHIVDYTLSTANNHPLFTATDIDNDGKSEIVVLERDGHSGRYYIAIIGKEWQMWKFNQLSLPSVPEKIFTADFNGDGMTDLMAVHETGYTIFWNGGGTMPFSDSNKKTGTSVYDAKYVQMGDFNGDGYPDFVSIMTDNNQLFLSYGYGNGSFLNYMSGGNFNITDKSTEKDDNRMACLVHDFDHDGRSDMVIEKADYSGSSFTKSRTVWLRSTGSGFVQVKEATSKREDDGESGHFTLGDFNGDGNVEVMNYGYDCFNGVNTNDSPVLRYYTMTDYSASCGKLTGITDGYGNTTVIQYAPLPTSGAYTPYSDAVLPMADITLPLQVVRETVSSNGAAYDITTGYSYGGMKVHTGGRGVLGFSMTRSTMAYPDNASTQNVVSEWNMEFSVPLRSTVTSVINGETSTSVTQLSLVRKTNTSTGNKNYFTYVSSVTDTDLDGHVTITSSTYNTAYGYLTSQQVSDDGGSMYRRTDYSSFVKKGGVYLPQSIVETWKHSDDTNTYSTETHIAYTATGLKSSVSSNYNTSKALTTNYTYDGHGNVLTELSSGTGVPHITYYYEYTNARDLQRTYTSPATTVMEYTCDIWGNVLAEQDKTNTSNVLTTAHTYDTWGRPVSTVEPTGVTTYTSYYWGNTMEKKYYVYKKRDGEPWTRTWFDSRGRETLAESVGQKGISLKTETTYNSRGLVSTRKTYRGSTSWTENLTYDGRGRVLTDNITDGIQTSYSYGDRSVTTTTGGRTYVKTFDAWGNVLTSSDPVSEVDYTYFSNGKPASATSNGHTVTMEYDDAGNQTELCDPDAGTMTYIYDSAGHLLRKTDGRGQTIHYAYDSLGRLSQEWTEEDYTDYTYGTSGNSNLRLVLIDHNENTVSYTYDQYGRSVSEIRTLPDGTSFPFAYTYNSGGQLSQTVYPGSLTVGYAYDTNGYQTAMTVGGTQVWSMTSYNGYQMNTVVAGTPVQTMFDTQGRIIAKIKNGPSDYLNFPFACEYDSATGNIISRINMNGKLQTEQFTYDNMDRLTSVTMPTSSYSSLAYLADILDISVEQAVSRFMGSQYETKISRGGVAKSNAVMSSSPAMTISYDDCGNITSKTGIGDYDYDSTRPHAVTSVDNTSGEIPSSSQTVNYNYYGKVRSIIDGSYMMNFTYGPGNERWKTVLRRNGAVARTTLYAGDYEKVTENGITKEFYYIGNDVLVVKSGGTLRKYCLWTDNLGTIQQILNNSRVDAFYAQYDAWGNQTVTRDSIGFHRGYTGHEMLPEFGLINMNGRLYDPKLGRFLSPDNYVQMPDFSQSFNRYSYCLNNPLRYNDPSGEIIGLDDIFVIAAMAYIGGVQANMTTKGNPINPLGWNWKNTRTYSGIINGALFGMGVVGISLPNFNLDIPGTISNGLLQAGKEVALNGALNLIDGNKFFDGWKFSAIYGFSTGAYAGYQLADQKGLNMWWGNKVQYGRTKWSFLTSEKPMEVIDFHINDVGNNLMNDCVPTSIAEIANKFGYPISYEDAVNMSGYKPDTGVENNGHEYEKLIERVFYNTDKMGKRDFYKLMDPSFYRNVAENGGVVHLRWNNPGHADNVRLVKLYKNASKNEIIFRNSSFNMRMDPVKFNKNPHKLVNAFIINR